MKRTTTIATLAILCAMTGLNGCTQSVKGAEEGAPVDGKADSFRAPTEHGEIAFGTDVVTELDFDERFHAYDFALSGDAEVAIATSLYADNYVDTVVYLYREGERGYGSYIHMDDDGGEELFSRIDADLEDGRYRILVKGYSRYDSGPFTLTVECAGEGCAPPRADLAAEFSAAAEGAIYISEADYEPVFIRVTPTDADVSLTPEAIGELFRAEILEGMEGRGWDEITVDGDSDDLLQNLAEIDPDDDPYYQDSARAWQRIDALFEASLTDSQTFIVGPADEDGNMLDDHGLYLRGVVGRTADGDVAGFVVGVVWT